MFEYRSCVLITNDLIGPCTELLTTAVRGDDTAALCCDVAAFHSPAKPFDTHFTQTTSMTIDEMVTRCEFFVTYAPKNAAWCSTWDGWKGNQMAPVPKSVPCSNCGAMSFAGEDFPVVEDSAAAK